MNEASLRTALQSIPLGGLRYYQTIGSTNDAAFAWASEGAQDLSLIVAEEQTQGRGRGKRQWITNPESSLAFSMVLYPDGVESVVLPLYSALGALAVSEALEMAGLHPQIKWPNDVLLNRKKVCGILAESVWSGERVDRVVLGIGVNVKPGSIPPQETLLFPTTCIESEIGLPMDRVSIMRDILSMLIKWRQTLGSKDFIQAWDEHLAFRGEWVVVSTEGKPVYSGRVTGLEEDGGLRLEDDTGKTISVQFGEVSLRPVV